MSAVQQRRIPDPVAEVLLRVLVPPVVWRRLPVARQLAVLRAFGRIR